MAEVVAVNNPDENVVYTDINPSVEFLRVNLNETFDETKARLLFNCYCVEGETGTKLDAGDLRAMLYHLRAASNEPVVVPDHALEYALFAIRPQQPNEVRGQVTWEQFRDYFVSSEEAPLLRLKATAFGDFNLDKLQNAVLIHYQPVTKAPTDLYDRHFFTQLINESTQNATDVFIYFIGSGDVLALVCIEPNCELPPIGDTPIQLFDCDYILDIKPFHPNDGVFPPFERKGGVQTRVVRAVADSYVKVATWDAANYKIGEKVEAGVRKVVAAAGDALSKLDERANISQRVAQMDEQHGVSTTLTEYAEKTSEKAMEIRANNPAVDRAARKVGAFVQNVANFVTSVSKETKQNVTERRASDAERNATQGQEGDAAAAAAAPPADDTTSAMAAQVPTASGDTQ